MRFGSCTHFIPFNFTPRTEILRIHLGPISSPRIRPIQFFSTSFRAALSEIPLFSSSAWVRHISKEKKNTSKFCFELVHLWFISDNLPREVWALRRVLHELRTLPVSCNCLCSQGLLQLPVFIQMMKRKILKSRFFARFNRPWIRSWWFLIKGKHKESSLVQRYLGRGRRGGKTETERRGKQRLL